MKNTVKFEGEYQGFKDFKLGYAIHWCCDGCCGQHRPEIVVKKGEAVVGRVR